MITKGQMCGLSLLLLTLIGCGGSGSGSPAPDPVPVDPGPETTELEVTVTGLATELTVTWQGQTIVLTPDRLSARAETTASTIADPQYQSPQYQNCAEHQLSKTDGKYTLTINCAQPDTLRLRVTISGLDGQLDVRWFDQDRSYAGDVNGDAIAINPGVLVEPAITAMPDLQNCSGEFTTTDDDRLFDYRIDCSERVVINKILIDGILSYPVTLVTGGQDPLIVQDGNAEFPADSSPLDDVLITDTGGTQQCVLEKQAIGSDRSEQNWSLSCREYLVYSDIRDGQAGAYLVYDDGEQILLEAGEVSAQTVKTFSTGNRHAVLHPDFGVRTLDFSPSGVTWQPLQGVPVGRVYQAQLTHNRAFVTVISQVPAGFDYSAWIIGEDLQGERISWWPVEESRFELLPVAPRSDLVGVDVVIPGAGSRNVILFDPGVTLGFPVTQTTGVVHMVQTPQFQSQHLYWLFYPDGGNGSLGAHFSGSLTPDPDFQADAQANIATWYDDAGNQRLLLLGEGVGGPEQPRRLLELDIQVHSPSWGVPLDLSLPGSPGYMGTDDKGQTLVVTSGDNELEDGLALLATARGIVDLEALRREAGITGPLRIRPLEKANAGGILRRAQPYNGWLLMFEGETTGKVWLTNGEIGGTWEVTAEASWDQFRSGAYRLIAAGVNMAVVSYAHNGVRDMIPLGIAESG